MSLVDPMVLCNAADNLEAHLISNILNEAGVEAMVVEDVSQVFGPLPWIGRPQVWIERSELERAQPILDDYLARAEQRRHLDKVGPAIDVICEKCGKRSSFPADQRGTVQECSHCGAFVDVGDEIPFDDWNQPSDDK